MRAFAGNRWGTAPKSKSLACSNKTGVGCSGSTNLSAVDPICGRQAYGPRDQPRRGPQLPGGEYARPKPMKDTRNYGKRHPRFRFREGGAADARLLAEGLSAGTGPRH